MGSNAYGQCGHPLSQPFLSSPSLIPTLSTIHAPISHTSPSSSPSSSSTRSKGPSGSASPSRTAPSSFPPPNPPPRIIRVSAGAQHSAGVAADGSMWSFGWNGYGQLGLDTQVVFSSFFSRFFDPLQNRIWSFQPPPKSGEWMTQPTAFAGHLVLPMCRTDPVAPIRVGDFFLVRSMDLWLNFFLSRKQRYGSPGGSFQLRGCQIDMIFFGFLPDLPPPKKLGRKSHRIRRVRWGSSIFFLPEGEICCSK